MSENGALVQALDQAVASASAVRMVHGDLVGVDSDPAKWPQTGVQIPMAEWSRLVTVIRDLTDSWEIRDATR